MTPLFWSLVACTGTTTSKGPPTDEGASDTAESVEDVEDTGGGDSETKSPGPWCYTFGAASQEEDESPHASLEQLEIDLTTGEGAVWMRYTGGHIGAPFETNGVTWNGHSFVLSYHNGSGDRWLEIDPTRGEVEDLGAARAPSAIAWSGADYIVQTDGESTEKRYADLPSILSDTPSGTIDLSGVERFTVADDRVIYGMWHSADQAMILDASDGSLLQELPLEGYDTWVWGISVTERWLFAIDDGRQLPYKRIGWFNRETGERVADVKVPEGRQGRGYSGLYCTETRMTPP